MHRQNQKIFRFGLCAFRSFLCWYSNLHRLHNFLSVFFFCALFTSFFHSNEKFPFPKRCVCARSTYLSHFHPSHSHLLFSIRFSVSYSAKFCSFSFRIFVLLLKWCMRALHRKTMEKKKTTKISTHFASRSTQLPTLIRALLHASNCDVCGAQNNIKIPFN